MSVHVHCDYFADLRELVATKLADGFAVDPADDTDDVLIRYLNVRQRRIVAQPRSVRWSTELRAREASLAANLRRALANIDHSLPSRAQISTHT
jgi:hypothetical protein